MNKPTDHDLLNDLREVYHDLGYVTYSAYSVYGIHHPRVIVRRFGSWAKACEAAGVPMTRKSKKMIEMVTTTCISCDELFDRPKDDPSNRRCKVCRRNRLWAEDNLVEECLFA